MMRKVLIGMAAAAMIFALAPAAHAQESGEQSFYIYGGLYVPGIDDLDNDLTGGIGWSARPWDQFGWGVSAGFLDLNQNNVEPLDGVIGNASGYFADADIAWYPGGSNFSIFAGLGFGSVDVDIVGTVTDFSDDTLTYNYGVNWAWNFADNLMLRPQIKWRKWDGDRYSKTDEEYTLAFGWRF